jgi:hypothetical protein
MGQVFHGLRHRDRGGPSSNTPSQERLRVLAKRNSINQTTTAQVEEAPRDDGFADWLQRPEVDISVTRG